MPDQGPDQFDPDQWVEDFKSSLNNIGNPVDAPANGPGLLGSLDDLRDAMDQSDPAASVTASAAQRAAGASNALPYHSVLSPHSGHYATLDEAANAAASDVPKNAGSEYGAYFPGRYVTSTIDLGDGFGPQSVSYVDGYDYGGLNTSGNDSKVTLGPVPPHLGGWFHNHPWDPGVDNDANQRPSPGPSYDEGTIKKLHQTYPKADTYILGPDGVLRKFRQAGDKGQMVK